MTFEEELDEKLYDLHLRCCAPGILNTNQICNDYKEDLKKFIKARVKENIRRTKMVVKLKCGCDFNPEDNTIEEFCSEHLQDYSSELRKLDGKCINCGKEVEKDSKFYNVCKSCDDEGFE